MVTRKAEMQFQLRGPPCCGVGDDADQRPGLEVEPGPRPQRAEYRLLRYCRKLFHDRIGIELLIELVGVGRAHEIAAHRAAFGAQGAVGHCGVPPESVSKFPLGSRTARYAG